MPPKATTPSNYAENVWFKTKEPQGKSIPVVTTNEPDAPRRAPRKGNSSPAARD